MYSLDYLSKSIPYCVPTILVKVRCEAICSRSSMKIGIKEGFFDFFLGWSFEKHFIVSRCEDQINLIEQGFLGSTIKLDRV